MTPDRFVARRRSDVRPRSPLTSAVVAAVLALSSLVRPAGAAPSLEAYSLSAGGVSSGALGGCTTFQAPAPVRAFFGGGLGLPQDGLAACNVAGGFDGVTGVVGPLQRTWSCNSSWFDGTFVGTTLGQANYGRLVATAHAAFNGSASSTNVTGSESFGRSNETFTITSPSVPNGQSGTMRVLVTITGGLSTTGNGTADVELNYRVGSSIYTMFRSQANNAAGLPFLISIGGIGLSGFASAPGSMSGSGEPSTFAHSIVFGTPLDLDLGLFAYAVPGASSTVDSHFEAHVSGLVVTGPGGQVLSDIVVTSGSGTSYTPGGVAAVGDAPPGDRVRLGASPNPATSGARLSFRLPRTERARLEVFDASGRAVRLLRDGDAPGGVEQDAWWDGRDDRGARLPGGTYWARLRWAGESRTTRLVLVH